DRFLIEAARYNVFPLDDRFAERTDGAQRPNPFTGRKELTFYPGMDRLPEGSGPRLSNINHQITFHANLNDGVNGVLMCVGGDMGGWSLFCENGTLRYHYNWFGIDRYDVRSDDPLPPGPAEIRLEFECDDPHDRGGPADVRLFHNDRLVGEGRLPKQMLGKFGEPIDIGRDSLSPVCDAYRQRLPFLFSGTLERVEVSLGEGAALTEAEVMEEELHSD
ncbi:MAG TPA: arylsulfatase, partial [Myxococcaceae bacterium]|nr:arylsulfatase [Myxococcaceae bacterium]